MVHFQSLKMLPTLFSPAEERSPFCLGPILLKCFRLYQAIPVKPTGTHELGYRQAIAFVRGGYGIISWGTVSPT